MRVQQMAAARDLAAEQVRLAAVDSFKRLVGFAIEAEVRIECPPAAQAALSALGDELRFFLITSSAKVIEAGEGDAYVIDVRATNAPKCVRCWHRRPDVGSHTEHPELCDRCVTNVTTAGEERHYA